LLTIRALEEKDLDAADRIFRLAFGTWFGLADPASFRGNGEMVRTRWRVDPQAALGAYRGAELVGSSFASRWGSFGVFGPLTVRPDLWNQGIARRLLEVTLPVFERWCVAQSALFTFGDSAKHVSLYQKFGYWPQYLTAVMTKQVSPAAGQQWTVYSKSDKKKTLRECAALTHSIWPGLDLEREIRALDEQGIGETLLIEGGFAVCHIGSGSEAGSGSVYVKFGAVRPGADAPQNFARLVSACEALALERGARTLVAGVNTARHAAYRAMLERGFRTQLQGVAMPRPNRPGYNRPECFVIDDWR